MGEYRARRAGARRGKKEGKEAEGKERKDRRRSDGSVWMDGWDGDGIGKADTQSQTVNGKKREARRVDKKDKKR